MKTNNRDNIVCCKFEIDLVVRAQRQSFCEAVNDKDEAVVVVTV